MKAKYCPCLSVAFRGHCHTMPKSHNHCAEELVDDANLSYSMKWLRVITIVVGFPAGGATDVTTRLIAEKLSEKFGQRVIVENRVGANDDWPSRAA